MVLDGENGLRRVPEARHGPIVEVDVGDLAIQSLQRGPIDAKTVILARNLDLTSLHVADWLVRSTVPEGQFPGRSPEGQRQQLMPQADSEGRHLSGHLPQRLDQRLDRRRITRSIGHEQSLWVVRPDLIGSNIPRHGDDLAPLVDEMSEDVAFRPAVDGHHAIRPVRTLIHDVVHGGEGAKSIRPSTTG